MADNEEFLKKVYDKYLGSDYEWGDADLNPKREIRKSDEEQWEQDQEEILAIVESRLKELQAQAAKLPKYKKPEVIDNDNFLTEVGGVAGAPSPSDENSMQQMAMQAALGGDIGDNLFIPKGNFDDTIDFLLGNVIPQLAGILVMGPYDNVTVPGGPTLQTELFNPGCDTEDETMEKFESSNPEFNEFKNRLLEEAGDNKDEDDDDDTSAGGGGSGGAADQADKDADANVAAAQKAVAQKQKEVAECIAKELGILQAILILLKVINTLKKVLLLILSILVPIIKMIAFAAQCWINPPAAGEVIQMVAEKIAALLISVIGEIIQMIWDLLDMDCKTEMVQKVLDEINEVLSGVDSAVNMTKNLVNFGIKQYKENEASIKDSIEKFRRTDQWDNVKEELTSKDEWKKKGDLFLDTMSDAMFGEEGPNSPAGWSNLLGAAMPSGIKDALNSLIDSTKDIVETGKKLADDTGLSDTGFKATLADMAEFLGKFNIK